MRSLSRSRPRSESEPGTLKRFDSRSPRFATAAPPSTNRTSQTARIRQRWRMTKSVQRAIPAILGDGRRGRHGPDTTAAPFAALTRRREHAVVAEVAGWGP